MNERKIVNSEWNKFSIICTILKRLQNIAMIEEKTQNFLCATRKNDKYGTSTNFNLKNKIYFGCWSFTVFVFGKPLRTQGSHG